MSKRNYIYKEEYDYYIVYKTTNLINGRFYIGVHGQNGDPYIQDDYIGSGTTIKDAIAKYGKHNFKRETLHVFSSYDEAYEKEGEIVTPGFLIENKGVTYNLKPGGMGGFGMTEDHRETISKLMKGIPKSEEHKKKIGRSGKLNSMYGKCGEESPQYGLKRSDETRKKQSDAATKRMSDPEYVESVAKKNRGRKDINKDGVTKRVYPEEIQEFIDLGWSVGRDPNTAKLNGMINEQNAMTRRFKLFNVNSVEELEELFKDLYIKQNLTHDMISEMYEEVTRKMVQTICRKFGLVKSREERSSSRRDLK